MKDRTNQDILYKMRAKVTAQATNLLLKPIRGQLRPQNQRNLKRQNKKRTQKILIRSVSVKRVRNFNNRSKKKKRSMIKKSKSNLRVQMNIQ